MKRLPIIKEYLDNSVADDYELPFLDDEEELTDAEQAELDAEDDLPPFIDADDLFDDDDELNPLANPDLQWEKDEDDLFDDDVITTESKKYTSKQVLSESSEGDAYKYMKKVLMSLPYANELRQHYGENWTREIFDMIRNDFVHSGCDVYFVPGLARILFGELDYESEDEDTLKVRQLGAIVRFISNKYRNLFTRNLALIKKDKTTSAPLTFEQLYTEFGDDITPADESDDEALAEFAESLKLDLPVLKEAKKKKKKLPIRKDYKKSGCGY